MNDLLKALLAELKDNHDGDLDLENEDYYLFFKDGLFKASLDEEDKVLKAELVLNDSIKIYFSTKEINEEFDGLIEKPTDGNQ